MDFFKLKIMPTATIEQIRTLLARYGCSGDKQTQIMGQQSAGQKARIVFAKMAQDKVSTSTSEASSHEHERSEFPRAKRVRKRCSSAAEAGERAQRRHPFCGGSGQVRRIFGGRPPVPPRGRRGRTHSLCSLARTHSLCSLARSALALGAPHPSPLRSLCSSRCPANSPSLPLSQPHILMLDEPTNPLDMESIDALARCLNSFKGGIIIISHDMRLISQVAKDIYICDDKKIERFTGDIMKFKLHQKKVNARKAMAQHKNG
jgi:hypothetical protein